MDANSMSQMMMMAKMNPKVAAATGGLLALESIANKRQRKRELKAAATNSRISAIQGQLASMTKAAQGLKI